MTDLVRSAAYAVRLSFLGRLSKHRSGMSDAGIDNALRLSGIMSLKNIFDESIDGLELSPAVRQAVTDDFGLVVRQFVDQVAKEALRVVWSRRTSGQQVSFMGLVTDGRNKRMFDDMIVLCAEQQIVMAKAMQAWVDAKSSILVTHHGEQTLYKKRSLSELMAVLTDAGHIHPKSSATFEVYDKIDIHL